MQPKIAEVRAIEKMLSQEWDDVTELADAVVQKVMDMVEAREQWCVIAIDHRLGAFVFGMYDTEGRAKKAIGKSIVSPGPQAMTAWVVRVLKDGEARVTTRGKDV